MKRIRESMTERTKASIWVGLAILMTAGCQGSDLLGDDAPQGVDGLVLAGPQCPVASPSNPCPDLPHQTSIAILNQNGALVTRVSSGEDGRFVVGLKPGAYILLPRNGNPFPTANEVAVEVSEGVYTPVTINFDTGIR